MHYVDEGPREAPPVFLLHGNPTWVWRTPSAPFPNQILPWRLLHAPLIEPYIMARQGGFPGRGVYLSMVDRERYVADAQAAYEMVLPDPDGRHLTWQWPRSIPINPDTDIAGERFEWFEAGVGETWRRSERLIASIEC